MSVMSGTKQTVPPLDRTQHPKVMNQDRLADLVGGPVTVTADEKEQDPRIRMWQAVVLQAIYDALLDERPEGWRHKWSTVAATSSSNVPTVKDRARTWLLENGQDFAEVCGYAELDPDMVRASARRMLRNEATIRKARAIFGAPVGAKQRPPIHVRLVLGSGQLRDRG